MRGLKTLITGLVLGGLSTLTFAHNYGHTYQHGCHGGCHNTVSVAYVVDQNIYDLICGTYGGNVQTFCQNECTGVTVTTHGHHMHHGTVKGPHRHRGYLIANFGDACHILCHMRISVDCRVTPQQFLNNGGTQGTTTATAAANQGNLVLWIEY